MGTPPDFDPEHLRLPPGIFGTPIAKSNRPPRHLPGQALLKGPIPWAWLVHAGRLPGKAMHVALYLWREAGCKKNCRVRFCLTSTSEMRVNRQAARRALKTLASVGLVSVVSRKGGCSDVTLLSIDGG